MFGFTSLALSLAAWHPTDFSGAAQFVRNWLPRILANPLHKGALLNVNIPNGTPAAIRGCRVVRLGSRIYHDVISKHTDPRGKPYLWIGGHGPTWTEDADTDFRAVEAGYVAVTPLIIDLTHYELLAKLSSQIKDDATRTRKEQQG
jgi:5'-nucleotidase